MSGDVVWLGLLLLCKTMGHTRRRGTSKDLYEVLPYAPLVMRSVDSGSVSDNDGRFE